MPAQKTLRELQSYLIYWSTCLLLCGTILKGEEQLSLLGILLGMRMAWGLLTHPPPFSNILNKCLDIKKVIYVVIIKQVGEGVEFF